MKTGGGNGGIFEVGGIGGAGSYPSRINPKVTVVEIEKSNNN